MNKLKFNRMRWSAIFWDVIKNSCSVPKEIAEAHQAAELLREQAEYNTGSLTVADMNTIYKLTNYFQPSVVAEVGTFIGRSTAAIGMGMGMGMGMRQGIIHTCDFSNDIKLPIKFENIEILQYPKMRSADMFQSLMENNIKVDLFYIDGRLAPDELTTISEISHENSIYILDDFEGVEKGVLNAIHFLKKMPKHFLIYPAHFEKTAVIFPPGLIQFVIQG